VADLARHLEKKLKNTKKVAVLGIGSDLRQDDVAGMMVTSILAERISRHKPGGRLKIFDGATAPENLTGEIRKFKPSVVIIVDSAQIGQRPGTILVLDPLDIGDSVTFSTHKLPAKILMDYFARSIRCRVILIGIQPSGLSFGKKPSGAVASAAKYVSKTILGAIRATN
jgi:hydrogenase 3 maturation protease